MITRWRGVFLACAAVALAFTAAACGDDDADSSSSAQQGDVDTLTARVQRNEVLLALKAIGDLPLHDIDEAIAAGEPGNDALPAARLVVRVAGLTEWPASLESDATAVEDAAIELVRTLDDGDIEAAKQPAADLHDLWHDFEGTIWAEYGADLPPEAGLDEDHSAGETPGAEETHSADEGTPAAGATESDDDHSE